MNDFLYCDNEYSLEYIESIIEDVNDVINSESVENAKIESSDDKTEAMQMNDEEQLPFTGFDGLCGKNACRRG